MMSNYDIAAYVWPAYSGRDRRARLFWDQGIGEWQTVLSATAKYPGHPWPRRPLWGCVDEADPAVMAMELGEAAKYGVNLLIYDWYWYDGGPYLEQCLDEGYLKAETGRDKVKFALMYADHDVSLGWNRNLSHLKGVRVWRGGPSRRDFEVIVHRWIEQYFHHPDYYTIDGKPLLSIYSVTELQNGLGGEVELGKGIEYLRCEAEKSGLPGLHLQSILYCDRQQNLSGFDAATESGLAEKIEKLGFDSVTHYQFAQAVPDINMTYREVTQNVVKVWEYLDQKLHIPYFPHVTLGWDNNPRFSETFPIIRDNTPEAVREAFAAAKAYLDSHRRLPVKLVTVNSWNEWTEGSYLQPDDRFGYGYLEALKSVFQTEKSAAE